ncbi:Alpha/Beta hydrolase protein [Neohortaea acidophila]|uniref:Dipeptidyl-peptidase V n=1 Tax=Neohortaea acidophila TaxID=245834 RepID=A0A6A6PS27_9PEZI|nr:Alpha/Beta hydrolase protein [Neohortaea acidophila]KAF2482491.1 Alpha/Beta hydrolase protein [Neohortaea acidophila]
MVKFTAASFFEAPTISPATANPSGTYALYQETSYSFQSHSKRMIIKLLNLATKEQTDILEGADAAPAVWLSDNDFVWLSTRKTGNTQLFVANIDTPKDVQLAGTIVGTAHGLKVKVLDQSGDGAAIAFAARANADGTLWNAHDEPEKAQSSAQYYTSNYVRHWDSWSTPQRNAIFYSYLRQDEQGRYEMLQVYNALRPTHEKLESPTPPFGGAEDFDIGQPGLVFVAKDPGRDHSLSTARDVYLLKTDFRSAAGKAIKVATPGLDGHAGFPCFSDDGHKIAFLKMKHEGAEADKQRPMVVEDIPSLSARELLQSSDGKGSWPLTPETLAFWDDNTLLLTAFDKGRCPLFVLDTKQSGSELPRKLTQHGSVKYAERIGPHKLLFTGDSLTDSGYIGVLNLEKGCENDIQLDMIVSSAEYSKKLGLSPEQISDMHWKGDHDRDLHALIMKPSNFNENKLYPIFMLIHGGPQYTVPDSWNDAGNPRPQIWAEQGYVVVAPDFTGSRGYGQDFMDAIRNNWGGSPYVDLAKCLDHLEKNVEYADVSRAVAGGVSFGGYLTNWIQGQELGRRFKALFTHNGVFSMYSLLATDELFFPRQDLGGFPWDSAELRENWERWDPARFAQNWATPHLIVHTDRDFRHGVENGLAAFNVLQSKGVPSAFLHFQDERHVPEEPENLLVLYHATLNLVNKYVGLPAAAEEIVPIR